jgi:DNA-binding MarR family transcriptional regulator
MNMHNVKERMIDRAPNATRLTDKLIAKDLVERERCEEDRRVVYVRISPKGAELLAKIDELNKEDMRDLVKKLTTADATHMNEMLDRIRG